MFWTFLEFFNYRDKRREAIFLKFGHFSALFVLNRPKICPAAPVFIRTLLTYAAKQSASR
jgi:hypothetical protein